MPKTNYFFERQEFMDVNVDKTQQISKPYYRYLGYLRKNSDYKHPVLLYFGKDEIVIDYVKEDGKILKVFSLYVAEGAINQTMLEKKVEGYALMPLWPLSDFLLKSAPDENSDEKSELDNIYVDPVLLKTGFFACYYGFELRNGNFRKINLPCSRNDMISINNKKLVIKYTGDVWPDTGKNEDEWEICENGDIKPSKINFMQIILDFLFELEFASTFEDENFYELQPHLQNNLVFDALTKKCRYLSQLAKLFGFSLTTRKTDLPKPFMDAEKEWLNVCRLEKYSQVFESPNSLFFDPEEEVKKVFFKSTIGQSQRPRKKFLKSRENAYLKNDICSFFMRKYNIWHAFKTLMPSWCILLFPIILLAIPLGDYFLHDNYELDASLSTICLPFVILCFISIYYIWYGVNLFKLLLPRLFLGIMLGWSIFWSTEELWKMALSSHFKKVLITDACLLIIIFLYIFTDIGNRIYKKTKVGTIISKSFNLIVMSLFISFVMGFYVIQFYAPPMLENSGFLGNKRLYQKGETLKEGFDPDLDAMFVEHKSKLADNIKYFCGQKDNYKEAKIYFCDRKIIYIWSILFSQFVASILIGVVLQLLWEDRPITEPL